MKTDILIVGAGHGGAQAALALRQHEFAGSIALLGEEPDLPYERPPLSKEYLSGEKEFDRIVIRKAEFWAERDVALLPGRRVTAVDPAAKIATCADGSLIAYGHMIWAAGGAARRLTCPGHDLAGIHTIRSRADVDRIRAELASVHRVGVIGGGYIGLEAAAVLSKLGKQVTLFESLDRVLARVAGEELSRFFESEHRAHGVELRLAASVQRMEGTGRVSGIGLADGSVAPCDMAIVGIGIVPAVEPLLAAGAEGGNGVLVDAACRTILPGIFAIGDCVLHPNRFAGGALIRLESVQNAHDQAAVAARTICGQEAAYDSVPWFWSNQYDLRLQTVGLSLGHDAFVLRGDPAQRSFSVVYLRQGRIIALDCVNAVRHYMQGKKLVAEGLALKDMI